MKISKLIKTFTIFTILKQKKSEDLFLFYETESILEIHKNNENCKKIKNNTCVRRFKNSVIKISKPQSIKSTCNYYQIQSFFK